MAATNIEETWQYNKTVLERNKHMLENQLATDATFLVGENPARRNPAHKYVLISNSPVFYSMFCGVLKERGEVNIPDITPDTFTQMLRYLYYEEADITGESVMQIMYASKKYLILGLTKKCTDFLENIINSENAAMILEQCLMFDEQAMISKCMEVIGEETQKVIQSEGFGNISNDTLVKILESDSSSTSEVELFKASVDWVRRNISGETPSGDVIRNKLGKALFKLRFPVMTCSEFANVVLPTDVLSEGESLLCFRYFSQDTKPTNLPFLTYPRVDNSCKYIHLKNKNKEISNSRNVTYPRFTVKNNTSRDLSIKGFVSWGRQISYLFFKPNTATPWSKTSPTQSVDTCSKGRSCILSSIITIPTGSTYDMDMISASGAIRCIPTTSGLTFEDHTGMISVLVNGDIPFTEILIAKSKI